MMMTDNHPLSFVLQRSFSISSTDSKVKNTWIENTFCISEASRGGGGGVACGLWFLLKKGYLNVIRESLAQKLSPLPTSPEILPVS